MQVLRTVLMGLLVFAVCTPAVEGQTRAAFDNAGRLLMNGTPRFVLGVYDSGGSYSSDRAFWEQQIFSPTGPRGLAGIPLNLYLNYWLGNMPIGQTEALLDVLHSHGMMYLQTGNCFESGSWTRMPFSIASQAYVQQFARHPAAAGYYIMDECADSLIAETRQHHQQLKAWDAQGISFAATLAAGYRDPALWKDAADVLGTDPYPLYGAEPAQGYTHFIVADYTAKLRWVARSDRPIWTVLQFFKFTSNSRMPTESELRSHAVMAVVEGAQGLFWWDIGVNGLRKLDSGTVSTSMGYLKTLTTELAGLEPALLAPPSNALVGNSTAFADPVAGRIAQLQRNIQVEWLFSRKQWYQAELDALKAGDRSKSPMLQGAANIRTLTKVVNGVGYVFAYNYTNQSTPVTFAWQSPLASVRESRDGRSFPVSGTTWSDTFGAYEARIYVVNGTGTPSASGGNAAAPGAGLAVSFTNPADGATVSGTATVTMAASGGTGTGYTFKLAVDGATIYTGTNPSFGWNTAGAMDGDRALTATVSDSAGRTATATRTVKVGNTGTPGGSSGARASFTTSFSYPATGATVSGTQTVGIATTAAWGKAKTITLSVDGTVLTAENVTGTTLWYAWDTTKVSNGSRALAVTVSMNGETATTTLPVMVSNGGWVLGLSANARSFSAGDTLELTVAMNNPGTAQLVDVYFAITIPAAAGPGLGCPGGDAAAFFVESSADPVIRCLSDSPATFPAYATSRSIPAGLPPTGVSTFFTSVWPEAPAGSYTAFIGFAVPGSFARGSIAAGDLIAVATETLTFGP